MRKALVLLAILGIVCLVSAILVQAQSPKPDPAIMKLHSFVGNWTYQGEYKAGPLGPGGKITGIQDAQMTLGGFFLEMRWKERGLGGETQGFEIDAYNPANKNFTYNVYLDRGGMEAGVFTFSGNTWNWSGKNVAAGKEYLTRGIGTIAADSITMKAEISPDGKTWMPFYEQIWTKTKPVPKK
jgi:hypothetical protein